MVCLNLSELLLLQSAAFTPTTQIPVIPPPSYGCVVYFLGIEAHEVILSPGLKYFLIFFKMPGFSSLLL